MWWQSRLGSKWPPLAHCCWISCLRFRSGTPPGFETSALILLVNLGIGWAYWLLFYLPRLIFWFLNLSFSSSSDAVGINFWSRYLGPIFVGGFRCRTWVHQLRNSDLWEAEVSWLLLRSERHSARKLLGGPIIDLQYRLSFLLFLTVLRLGRLAHFGRSFAEPSEHGSAARSSLPKITELV